MSAPHGSFSIDNRFFIAHWHHVQVLTIFSTVRLCVICNLSRVFLASCLMSLVGLVGFVLFCFKSKPSAKSPSLNQTSGLVTLDSSSAVCLGTCLSHWLNPHSLPHFWLSRPWYPGPGFWLRLIPLRCRYSLTLVTQLSLTQQTFVLLTFWPDVICCE